MQIKALTESRQKIIIYTIELLILIFCISYIEFIYYTNIYPDKNIKETFEQSNCFIVQKKMTQAGRFLHRYRADFLVTYQAQGSMNSLWVSGNGLDKTFTTDKASQQDLLDQFDQGSQYPCWYNPVSPRMLVLILRHNWSSTFPLFIPSVIALIMLYYLMRGVVELITFFYVKRQKQ